MTNPPAKFDADLLKETKVIVRKNPSVWLKTTSFSKMYSTIDAKKAMATCVLIWYTHLQSLMLIDQRKLKLSKNDITFDARPTTNIPKIITMFHLEKNWLKS